MSDLDLIHSALGKAARRHRWQRAWRGLWNGVLVGAVVALSAIVIFKLFPVPISVISVALGLGGICVIAGFLQGWLRPVTEIQAARWIDEKVQLQERLSTALEVEKNPQSHWRDLVISDAARHAADFLPETLLPFKLPRAALWSVLILAIMAGLGFVPEFRTKAYRSRVEEREVIKQTGQQITDFTRQTLAHRVPVTPETREALENIGQLGEQMTKASLTRGDALKELASAVQKIQDDLKQLGKNPGLKPLDRAAKQAGRNGASSNGELQKQIESLQKAMGNSKADPASVEKMKNELQKAEQAAAGMPKDDSAQAEAARQQLAQTLSNLAQQAKELGQTMPNLDEAIEALKNNNTDLFVKDMAAAVNDMEKLAEMAKALQQLQKQAGQQLGRDLAEQLKNGQADAASKTLEKMIAQLKSSGLSSEEMKKMVEEVAKAVDPASQYGKVADLLKQAEGELKGGKKPAAAQSLAEASKELQKLLEQMNDAQAMMASLDALKKAELAIANKGEWGKCPICGEPGGT